MLKATLLDDVCAAVGWTATCAIVAWWGGRQLYVPPEAREDHPIALVIGMPAFRALVREFGGLAKAWSIPTGGICEQYVRDRRITERYAAGATPGLVAEEFGIGLRRAQQLRVELEQRGWLEYAARKKLERAGSYATTPSPVRVG